MPSFNRFLQMWRGLSLNRNVIIGEGSRVNRLRIFLNMGDRIIIGKNSIIETKFMSDRPGAQFKIGDRTFIGKSLFVAANSISVGDDVLISWAVTIVDHDSHNVEFSLRSNDVMEWGIGRKDWSNVIIRPVTICDKVWIGFGCAILKGVNIGEGAVVAAMSVVTKDVEPWTLVAGNPARVIRKLTESRS